MPAGYSFRPRLWALALAAAACAGFIALGNWQAGRAGEKRALAEQRERALKAPLAELSPSADSPDLAHRRVGARGTFVPQQTILLDNKIRHGRPGYEVVTPLRLARSDVHVLVNRGWVEAPARRDQLPGVPTPAGEIRIEGIAFERFPRIFRVAGPSTGPVRQTVDLAAFVAETGLALKSVAVEQHSETGDGLVREWPRPDAGIEKHESYSLQWYSFAALAVALALVLSFRKRA